MATCFWNEKSSDNKGHTTVSHLMQPPVHHKNRKNKNHKSNTKIHTTALRYFLTLPHCIYWCIYMHIYLQFAGPGLDTEMTTLQRRTRGRKTFFQTLKVSYLNFFLFFKINYPGNKAQNVSWFWRAYLSLMWSFIWKLDSISSLEQTPCSVY